MSDNRSQTFCVERSLLDLYFCATLIGGVCGTEHDDRKEWILEDFYSWLSLRTNDNALRKHNFDLDSQAVIVECRRSVAIMGTWRIRDIDLHGTSL
jgi:hypothetical protein